MAEQLVQLYAKHECGNLLMGDELLETPVRTQEVMHSKYVNAVVSSAPRQKCSARRLRAGRCPEYRTADESSWKLRFGWIDARFRSLGRFHGLRNRGLRHDRQLRRDLFYAE